MRKHTIHQAFVIGTLFMFGCGIEEGDAPAEEIGEGDELGEVTSEIEAYRTEAEHMTINNGYTRYIVGVGSGGQSLGLMWNGGPYVSFYASTAGNYRLRPALYGAWCNGYPIAQLLIDARLLSRHEISGWPSYPVSGWMYLQPGWHQFAVAFENDYANSSCDRNIYFDYMVIERL